jgi:hypothetical protein
MAEAPDRYCGNCGHELSPEDKFCRNCGTPAHVAAKVPTPEADVPVPPPPPEGASEVASAPEGTVLQKWKPVMWGLVGVVILGALISAVQGGGGSPSQSGSGNQQEGQQKQAEAQLAADSSPERAEQDEGVEGGGPEPEANKPLQGEKAEPQDGQQQQQQQPAENKPKPPPEYTVGQTATVGNVQWTVTDAYRTSLLRSNFGTQKQGSFVVVDFTFTNNRSEEVTLDPQLHMTLKDGSGREFGTDSDAWEFVPSRLDIFLEPVNPGISQEGRVVYEVPPDAGGFVLILDDFEFLEDKTARYNLAPLPGHAYTRGGGF